MNKIRTLTPIKNLIGFKKICNLIKFFMLYPLVIMINHSGNMKNYYSTSYVMDTSVPVFASKFRYMNEILMNRSLQICNFDFGIKVTFS